MKGNEPSILRRSLPWGIVGGFSIEGEGEEGWSSRAAVTSCRPIFRVVARLIAISLLRVSVYRNIAINK